MAVGHGAQEARKTKPLPTPQLQFKTQPPSSPVNFQQLQSAASQDFFNCMLLYLQLKPLTIFTTLNFQQFTKTPLQTLTLQKSFLGHCRQFRGILWRKPSYTIRRAIDCLFYAQQIFGTVSELLHMLVRKSSDFDSKEVSGGRRRYPEMDE